jgi:hypothetical protein
MQAGALEETAARMRSVSMSLRHLGVCFQCASVKFCASLGFLLFGWVDPGGDGQFGWSRCDTLEPLRVGQEGGI